jgi:hypothetical protein
MGYGPFTLSANLRSVHSGHIGPFLFLEVFMSKFFDSETRKIAYVSLAVNSDGSDLEKTRQYCLDLPFQTVLLLPI